MRKYGLKIFAITIVIALWLCVMVLGQRGRYDYTTPSATVESASTEGEMLFWDANVSQWTCTEDAELFWDDVNKRLGIGTATPQATLDVNGIILADGLALGDAEIEHENRIHDPVYLSGQVGLDDLSSSGTYSLTNNAAFQIKIQSTGTPDNFEWRKATSGAWTGPVAMTGSAQLLQDGVSITWLATTGHTDNDEWEMNVGHEIHISEPVHVIGDITAAGDVVVQGAIRSLSPVRISGGLNLMGDATIATTESAMKFDTDSVTRFMIQNALITSYAPVLLSTGTNVPLSPVRSAAGQWMVFNDSSDIFGLYNRAGTPEGFITADIGSFCTDTLNGNFYIKTTDTVNTGWLQLGTSTNNIYGTDGTLAGARTIATDGNSLTIDGTGDIVFADSGNITTDGDVAVNGGGITSTSALLITPNAGNDLEVALSTTGDFIVNTDDLVVDTSTGNVGINHAAPITKLHIETNTTNDGILLRRTAGTGAELARLSADGTGPDGQLQLYDSGTPTIRLRGNPSQGPSYFSHWDQAIRVGFGTATPSATVDIEGTFQYVDGNEEVGAVLTSDATGAGSWEVPEFAEEIAGTTDFSTMKISGHFRSNNSGAPVNGGDEVWGWYLKVEVSASAVGRIYQRHMSHTSGSVKEYTRRTDNDGTTWTPWVGVGTSEAGDAPGQMLFWNTSVNKWLHTEDTELKFNTFTKDLEIGSGSLIINQGADDDEIISLKSSDVGHGMTGIAEADTYGTFKKVYGAAGGLNIRGMSDGDNTALMFNSFIGSNNPTDTMAAVIIRAQKYDGATGSDPLADAETAFKVQNEFTDLFNVLGGGNVTVAGYTKLGSNAPVIKMKKVTGTTGASEGDATNIAHGLADRSKILGAQVLVTQSGGNRIPPAFTTIGEHEYDFFIDVTNVLVRLTATNSNSIRNGAITVLLTYEE